MNQAAVRQVIAEWLEDWSAPAMVPRNVEHPDIARMKNTLAVVGPRRAGKTFFMYQLVQQLLDSKACSRNEILFVDFEDYRLIDFSASDIGDLLAIFQQLAGNPPKFLFFDEIQHLPKWSRVLRTLHNQRRYRLVISGSNSELLRREIATELRGRYRDLLMLPFSFAEFLKANGVTFTKRTFHTAGRGKIVGMLDRYLATGGFPEVVEEQGLKEKRRLLQDYFQTIFYKDIVDRYNIRAKYVLDTMMDYCLNTYSDLFSISRFEKQLKTAALPGSKRTISNYLKHLEEAFFLTATEKFSYSPRKRLMNPKKIYLMDTGFCALSTEFSENRGKRLENCVAVELLRRQDETFYFRGTRECDLIIKGGRKPVTAIQVCWELTPRNQEREVAGLCEAAESLGIDDAYILTYNQERTVQHRGRRFPVKPAWKWLLHGHGRGQTEE